MVKNSAVIFMKNNLKLWGLLSFAFTSFAGTLLHFLYDIAKGPFTALFSGVNESTWEHMKLLFFPMLAFSIIESFFLGKEYPSFWCIKLRSTLLGLILIPVIFYTLRGAFGPTPDFINITIFFVSAGLSAIYETGALERKGGICVKTPAILGFVLIAIAFWVFTFITPELPLFLDPVDMTYGI